MQKKEVEEVLPGSFVEWIAGNRIRMILAETADERSKAHLSHSLVFEIIADFSQAGRTLHAMTQKSVSIVSAHLGNAIFTYREPLLNLKASHQELLRAAIGRRN